MGGTEQNRTVTGMVLKTKAKRPRYQLASTIAQQSCTTMGREGSQFTVARRLHKGSLFASRPESCIPLKVGP
ncbi:hypothetical protein TNCV_980091 [Trichonephila clavipes]|uniref:Uncharacterized protein n=1 Tax=Trichonephila clavipes TaxID=2585209 RepID=A0A8X6V897_TRICX|nr:hypothetical protein TNCV_980091 [Trichonephila clavipes]